jgi:anaerobic nitric oxide reductase transcription regulator
MKPIKYFIPHLIPLLQNLTQSMALEVRYQQLLQAWSELFLCDACVLLKLEGDTLIPQAAIGLNRGFMGRRFEISDHPRLERIVQTQGVVRFSANSTLPDPYDGLIDTPDGHLHVHDCMGAMLYL